MNTLKLLRFSFIFLICSSYIFGQSNIDISHMTEGYGLYYRWVHDITQDKRGFIWMGNHTGLRAYDGSAFLTFQHSEVDSNSISSSSIYRVCSVRDDVWALGNDDIYNKVNTLTGDVKRIKSPYYSRKVSTDSEIKLKHLAESSKGELILLYQITAHTSRKSRIEMWKFDHQKNSFKELIGIDIDDEDIFHFTERDDGKIWLWSKNRGYFLLDLDSLKFEKFTLPVGDKPSGLGQELSEKKSSLFWYPKHTSKDSKALDHFSLPNNLNHEQIEHLSVDNVGGIWFYDQDEVYRFDPSVKEIEHFVDPIFKKSRGLQKMFHFFVDQEGAYWNGHIIGAVRFKAKQNLFEKYLNIGNLNSEVEDFNSSIRQILEFSSDYLLIKNDDEKFGIIDLLSQDFKLLKINLTNTDSVFKMESFLSAFISKDGFLWANTKDEILQIDPISGNLRNRVNIGKQINEHEAYSKLSDYYPRFFEDNNGILWWCDRTGIYRYDEKLEKLTPSKADITPLEVDGDFQYASFDPSQNAIYAIYRNGIYIFNCEEEQVSLIEVFPQNESFDILTTDILFWKDMFWLATNKGLIKVDPRKASKKIYTRRHGLASTLVYSIIGAEDELWVATQNGLSQFNPNTLQTYNYYAEQGLTSNEFNTGSKLRGSDGRIYFGGQNGMIGLNSTSFSLDYEKRGSLYMTNLLTFSKKNEGIRHVQKSSLLKDKIVIEANEKNVALRFVLTLFDDIKQNQYSYYLEGLENSWIDNGNSNLVRYSHIPSGSYILHVKAKGPNKLPALNEIAIPFLVKEYWFKTNIAIVCYVLFFLAGVWSLYRYQLSQKLAKQEAERIKEVDELRRKMYTNITHEFRTPLTVVLGMNSVVSKIAEDQESVELKEASEMISRNGNGLLGLINQLLDISKLQTGKLNVNNTQGDIILYIKYLTESLESLAAEKEIKLHFESYSDSIIMDYDKEKISHIVINLLSNAIKFTNENGNVHIIIAKEEGLKLIVRDDGIGIEEEEIDKIFDRFYQTNNKHEKNYEGTGVGLFLVKELILLLGGTIDVKSTVGKGSEFLLRLPISNEAPLEASWMTPSQDLRPDRGANERQFAKSNNIDKENLPLIIIVEDNRDVANYIGSILETSYRLIFAKDGEEGIKFSIEEIPDLIISDVMMPKKDGFELCDTLKRDERTSHIPVILLTAKADSDSKIAGLEFGADAYLAKPFNNKELLIRINNLLLLRESMRKRFVKTDFSKEITITAPDLDPFLLKTKELILANIDDENLSISKLCSLLHISRAQLHRKLTALTGKSSSHLIKSIRLEKAQELLSSQEMNVSEVAYTVGFKTQAHFSRVFSEAFGFSPSEFRNKSKI